MAKASVRVTRTTTTTRRSSRSSSRSTSRSGRGNQNRCPSCGRFR